MCGYSACSTQKHRTSLFQGKLIINTASFKCPSVSLLACVNVLVSLDYVTGYLWCLDCLSDGLKSSSIKNKNDRHRGKGKKEGKRPILNGDSSLFGAYFEAWEKPGDWIKDKKRDKEVKGSGGKRFSSPWE